MKIVSRFAYRLLLRLHPAGFQQQFGAEMLWIFDEQPGRPLTCSSTEPSLCCASVADYRTTLDSYPLPPERSLLILESAHFVCSRGQSRLPRLSFASSCS